jgi:tRNA A37 threonylcarbamoyladenosine biosynthesis protein TsaE
MITRELPQYADIVRRLKPVLAGLPPKLIAIDGPMGSGKTTLGRHLAWRFNVTLIEADPGSKPIAPRDPYFKGRNAFRDRN